MSVKFYVVNDLSRDYIFELTFWKHLVLNFNLKHLYLIKKNLQTQIIGSISTNNEVEVSDQSEISIFGNTVIKMPEVYVYLKVLFQTYNNLVIIKPGTTNAISYSIELFPNTICKKSR